MSLKTKLKSKVKKRKAERAYFKKQYEQAYGEALKTQQAKKAFELAERKARKKVFWKEELKADIRKSAAKFKEYSEKQARKPRPAPVDLMGGYQQPVQRKRREQPSGSWY